MEQQNEVLSNIPERDRPIFQFMFEYGVRPGEARALMKNCVANAEVAIKRAFSETELRERTKTYAIRVYKVTSYFANVLKTMTPNLSRFVFVRIDGIPYTSKNLNSIWKAACNKTGISIKLYNGVRHSLGCQLLDLGPPFIFLHLEIIACHSANKCKNLIPEK